MQRAESKESTGENDLAVFMFFVVFFFSLLPVVGLAEEPNELAQALERISGERMLADVKTLSGPEFNGRLTGTDEDLRSGRWFGSRLEGYGLAPRGAHTVSPPNRNGMLCTYSGGAQDALPSLTVSTIADKVSLRLIRGREVSAASIGLEFLPVLDSPTADLSGGITFVGYGISDPARGFDEYAGQNVRNRIVLFLRGKPEGYQRPISHAEKIRFAREKGAIGYLVATGPVLPPYEAKRGYSGRPSAFYGLADPETALPGAWISTELAARIVTADPSFVPESLRQVQEEINQSLAPRSRNILSTLVHLTWNTASRQGTLCNVEAVLDGKDLNGSHESILIGAHRDHFGRQAGLLFPGADDNATGTAVVMEVARVLAGSPIKPKRSIRFVSFTGEERGLLGSRAYVSHPTTIVGSVKAMINIDHAGVGNGRLTVGVTGLPKEFAQHAGEQANLADKLDIFGFFPGGDHVPFKEAGVPTVTVVSSGPHPDFHQPTDTADKVQPAILEIAAQYVLTLVWKLAYE